ncbi:MAG: hypothetical protein WC500_07145 [Candidatus Margulisiibacteriota bacterium]
MKTGIIVGIALLVIGVALRLPKRLADDLWEEIVNYTNLNKENGLVNDHYLNKNISGSKVRVRNVVEYCDLQIKAENNRPREIIKKIREFHSKAIWLEKVSWLFFLG